MISATELKKRLGDWLDGKLSLREFEEWFVPATWDAHKSGDREAESLVDEIELNLSEYTDRVISHEELRTRLRRELANAVRSFAVPGDAAVSVDPIDLVYRRPRFKTYSATRYQSVGSRGRRSSVGVITSSPTSAGDASSVIGVRVAS